MRRALRRGRAGEDGATAVEFALVLIPLLVVLLGSIQYGWYFFTAQSASSAARETARQLSVGDCQGAGEALSYARRQANVIDLTLEYGLADDTSDTAIDGSTGVLPARGDQLRVVVTADAGIINFVPVPAGGVVTRVTDARVEDLTQDSC
jgi:Flp pilus assembly protein TadG